MLHTRQFEGGFCCPVCYVTLASCWLGVKCSSVYARHTMLQWCLPEYVYVSVFHQMLDALVLLSVVESSTARCYVHHCLFCFRSVCESLEGRSCRVVPAGAFLGCSCRGVPTGAILRCSCRGVPAGAFLGCPAAAFLQSTSVAFLPERSCCVPAGRSCRGVPAGCPEECV